MKTVRLTFLDTPIIIDPSAVIAPVSVFSLAVFLTRAQSLTRRVWLGLLAVIHYVLADFIHFGGHIISSRSANAPMDEVHIKAPMPASVYYNNDVPPKAHILRSVGGPIGSGIFFSLALLMRALTPAKSPLRDFFNVMAIINSLLAFGSLIPLPIIDGGTMLKWSLVKSGQTEGQADDRVRQANLVVGGLAAVLGTVLAMRKRVIAGFLLLVHAAGFVAIGLGKIKFN